MVAENASIVKAEVDKAACRLPVTYRTFMFQAVLELICPWASTRLQSTVIKRPVRELLLQVYKNTNQPTVERLKKYLQTRVRSQNKGCLQDT